MDEGCHCDVNAQKRSLEELLCFIDKTEASRLVLFWITNHPETIHKTIFTRCIKVIRFHLPKTEERFQFFNEFLHERGYQSEIKNNYFWIQSTKFFTFRDTSLLARKCIQSSISQNNTITVNDMKSVLKDIHPASDEKTETALDKFSAMNRNDLHVESKKHILTNPCCKIIFCGILPVFLTLIIFFYT